MAAMKASRTIKEMPDVKCLLDCAPIALAAAENLRVATTGTRACQRIADGKTPHATDMSEAKHIVPRYLCFIDRRKQMRLIMGIESNF
jgi:hypothetical protein